MQLVAAFVLLSAVSLVIGDDQCNAYGPRKDCGASLLNEHLDMLRPALCRHRPSQVFCLVQFAQISLHESIGVLIVDAPSLVKDRLLYLPTMAPL